MKKEALEYHAEKKGKIATLVKTKTDSQQDLTLAYSPGVAFPCLEIEQSSAAAYQYTNKANLVAVVSNGTAVLGLGNIGSLASKPVMEGKALLFKKFADVDAVDLLIDSLDPEEIIKTIKLVSPTYGGVNLEDIKAPECFQIENKLKDELDIPVFHDDQHGTAVVSGAGLLNALELVGKKVEDIKLVVLGAGAAGLACTQFYLDLGVKKDNLVVCDSRGVIYLGRTKGMNEYKERFVVETESRTLAEVMVGADVFVGVASKDLVTPEMLKSMAERPIVFALSSPDPEIKYDLAKQARDDVILATGRSDYPNQINNVLGFPFIFRGALDVRARTINEEMKIAAAQALARVTKMPVLQEILDIYGLTKLEFGPDYLVPKPFDKRVAVEVSFAVAQAAIESGVAQIENFDLTQYRRDLEKKFS